jgi:hypothetical protein
MIDIKKFVGLAALDKIFTIFDNGSPGIINAARSIKSNPAPNRTRPTKLSLSHSSRPGETI